MGDDNGLVVEGIIDIGQSFVNAGSGLIDLGRTFHVQSFVTFVIKDFNEVIEDSNPSLSHQTASLLKLNKACAEAKGTPLSLRMLEGMPRSLKSLSNTAKA